MPQSAVPGEFSLMWYCNIAILVCIQIVNVCNGHHPLRRVRSVDTFRTERQYDIMKRLLTFTSILALVSLAAGWRLPRDETLGEVLANGADHLVSDLLHPRRLEEDEPSSGADCPKDTRLIQSSCDENCDASCDESCDASCDDDCDSGTSSCDKSCDSSCNAGCDSDCNAGCDSSRCADTADAADSDDACPCKINDECAETSECRPVLAILLPVVFLLICCCGASYWCMRKRTSRASVGSGPSPPPSGHVGTQPAYTCAQPMPAAPALYSQQPMAVAAAQPLYAQPMAVAVAQPAHAQPMAVPMAQPA